MSNNNVNENSFNNEFESIINFMICFSNLKTTDKALCELAMAFFLKILNKRKQKSHLYSSK